MSTTHHPGRTVPHETTEGRATTPNADRPEHRVTSLIKELRDETTELVREEVALARTEMTEHVGRAVRNVAYLAAGGLIAYLGLAFLLFAGSTGLAAAMVAGGVEAATAAWLSPLIVGFVVALIGYGLYRKAIGTLRREKLYPHETMDSMKETYRWAKDKVR